MIAADSVMSVFQQIDIDIEDARELGGVSLRMYGVTKVGPFYST